MLTFVSVCYASLRTSSSSQIGKLGLGSNEGMQTLLEDKAHATPDDEDEEEDTGRQRVVDNEVDGVNYSWTFFHITFAFAALYLTMVLTDYATIE